MHVVSSFTHHSLSLSLFPGMALCEKQQKVTFSPGFYYFTQQEAWTCTLAFMHAYTHSKEQPFSIHLFISLMSFFIFSQKLPPCTSQLLYLRKSQIKSIFPFCAFLHLTFSDAFLAFPRQQQRESRRVSPHLTYLLLKR